MTATTRMTVAATPLVDAPAVAALLARLDLGAFLDDDVVSFPGRNETWAGVTSAGLPVLVKRLVGEPGDMRRRLRRMTALAECLSDSPVIRTPRRLGSDDDGHLIAFEYLENAQTGTELLAAGDFTAGETGAIGRMIGTLHGVTPPAQVAIDSTGIALPPVEYLDALPLPAYLDLSFASQELWSILHNDAPLAGALRRLRADEDAAPHVLVHGDLRLDQVLRYREELYVTDWEECQLADPARDVGAFVGELLYRGVLGMAGGGDAAEADPEREAINRGADEFERLRPLIRSFWAGYHDARPHAAADETLAVRSVGFAGWHMFDRVFAAASTRSRLSPLERAAAGVGRTALLNPADCTTTVGLGGDRDA